MTGPSCALIIPTCFALWGSHSMIPPSTPLLANRPLEAHEVDVISPRCPRNSKATAGGADASVLTLRAPIMDELRVEEIALSPDVPSSRLPERFPRASDDFVCSADFSSVKTHRRMTPSAAAVTINFKSGAREMDVIGALCSVFSTYRSGYPGEHDQHRTSTPAALKSSFVEIATAMDETGSS